MSKNDFSVIDYREMPIEKLTNQQITSRIALLHDSSQEHLEHYNEEQRIIKALKAELTKRKENGKA